MKKLIIAFVAAAITAGAYAQPDSSKMNQQNKTQKPTMQSNPQDLNKTQKPDMQSNPHDLKNSPNQNMQKNPLDQTYPDGVIMQNGKMMKVKNGQTTILQDNEVTMSNGTKIMKDGTCINKDGTKLVLKDGERMDMSGNIVPMKSNADKNMYLVPDSTRNKYK